MPRALTVLLITALVSLLGSTASADGSATLISYGKEGPQGIKSVAFDYERPVSGSVVLSATGGPFSTMPVVSADTLRLNINNRCSATNLGGGFSYTFATGLECASFAAPSPDEPRRGQGRRPRRPSPEQIALALADRVVALAADPELRVAPSKIGLTGLESFFWLASPPRPIRAIASAGPVIVTAEAHPVEYVWDFGDGADHVSGHIGRLWTRRHDGTIGHTYEHSGRYDLTVEIVWQAHWRTGTGAWRHLGYFATTDSRRYPVRSLVAMLTRPGWRPR